MQLFANGHEQIARQPCDQTAARWRDQVYLDPVFNVPHLAKAYIGHVGFAETYVDIESKDRVLLAVPLKSCNLGLKLILLLLLLLSLWPGAMVPLWLLSGLALGRWLR